MKKNGLILGIAALSLLLAGCFQHPAQPSAPTTTNTNSAIQVNTNAQVNVNMDRGSDDTNDHLDDALKDLDTVE